jgi:tetratricopeptide (TPR) repeat protein
MADLFGLQDKIADGLARALGAKPAAAAAPESAVPPTKNPMAYELFLRAGERLPRLNRWDTRTAIEMLENAVQLDVRFAEAWSRLAEACLLMAISFEPTPQWIRRADQAARRALKLDPASADAHCTCGRILWSPAKGFQHGPALRALERARRLNPGGIAALTWRGIILEHVGLHEESKADFTAALAANPDDPLLLESMGSLLLYTGDYEAAVEYHNRALSLAPAHLFTNLFFPGPFMYAGQLDRAEERIRAGEKVAPRNQFLAAWEALLWAKRGENRKAEQAAQRCLRDKRILTYTHHAWHYAAAAYTVLGKPDQAVALLRKASASGLPNYPVFRDDQHLQPLYNRPQFLRLMADLKRTWERYKRDFGKEN